MPQTATTTDFDPRALRNAFGRFATGVTVITTVDETGTPAGLTANSFSSLSLSPPLVLWSIGKASSSRAAFEQADGFVIHVLADHQEHLSRHFSAAIDDRFADVDHRRNDRGLPVIEDCCARFECRTVAVHEGGDHLILVGEVEAFEQATHAPLLFWGGRYHHVAETTD